MKLKVGRMELGWGRDRGQIMLFMVWLGVQSLFKELQEVSGRFQVGELCGLIGQKFEFWGENEQKGRKIEVGRLLGSCRSRLGGMIAVQFRAVVVGGLRSYWIRYIWSEVNRIYQWVGIFRLYFENSRSGRSFQVAQGLRLRFKGLLNLCFCSCFFLGW